MRSFIYLLTRIWQTLSKALGTWVNNWQSPHLRELTVISGPQQRSGDPSVINATPFLPLPWCLLPGHNHINQRLIALMDATCDPSSLRPSVRPTTSWDATHCTYQKTPLMLLYTVDRAYQPTWAETQALAKLWGLSIQPSHNCMEGQVSYLPWTLNSAWSGWSTRALGTFCFLVSISRWRGAWREKEEGREAR